MPRLPFLGEVASFLIIAMALWIFMVKFLGWIMRSKPPTPAPTKEQALLAEIRDLLARQAGGSK